MVRVALSGDLLAGMSVNASVVEQQNGIDLEEGRLLLTDARAAILQVRAALAPCLAKDCGNSPESIFAADGQRCPRRSGPQ